LVRAAVGEVSGEVEMKRVGAYGADEPSARSAFGTGALVGRFPMVRFDQWAQEAGLARLDLVKMDVEGAELAALMGMRGTLVRLQPRMLFLEVNPGTLARAGIRAEQVRAELAQSHYQPVQSIADDQRYETVVFVRAGA
jgi:hypothetical protein